MGHLLDAGPGTARVEVRGSVAELAARARPTARLRIGFHEPNSPALIQQLVDALDAGAIPALAHPRWPKDVAADALRRAGADEPWQGAPIATLLFTSGSTAAPKIVAHTLDAHLTAARASKERVPYGPGDRWLLSLPLCHVGGLSLLFRTVCAGATLVLPDREEPLAAAVARTRPTHISLVATQLRDLLEDPASTAALKGCAAVLLGGGPCPEALVTRARDAGVALRRTYGMTEMGSQIATEQAGRVVALPGVEVRTDADEQLWVRGPSIFSGYLEGDALRRPFDAGWFATGDLAEIADDGAIRVLGRRDHQFVSGGENVRPEAVEAALAERGVEAVIVPIPDDRYGARPVAFTAGGRSHDDVARARLPDYARPVAWLELPPTRAIKPLRAELEKLAHTLLRRRS